MRRLHFDQQAFIGGKRALSCFQMLHGSVYCEAASCAVPFPLSAEVLSGQHSSSFVAGARKLAALPPPPSRRPHTMACATERRHLILEFAGWGQPPLCSKEQL